MFSFIYFLCANASIAILDASSTFFEDPDRLDIATGSDELESKSLQEISVAKKEDLAGD